MEINNYIRKTNLVYCDGVSLNERKRLNLKVSIEHTEVWGTGIHWDGII